jgi:hypothetical protein
MNQWDSRHVMLDSGRTALALRSLHNRDGHYPFVAAHRRRTSWQRLRGWLGLRRRAPVPA